MIKRILQSGFASLGAVSVLAVTPVFFSGAPAQAQATAIDGRLEEYGASTAPVLAMGYEGSAVEDLQVLLDEMGYYYGPIDGVYGAEVADAIEGFQEDYGLASDGIVGYNTWNSLIGIDDESIFEADDRYDAAAGLYTDYEDGVDYSYEGPFTDEVGFLEENEASPGNEGVF